MDEINGRINNKHEDVDAASLGADILNPFVHRLELDTTYDKLKTAFLTVALLPFRLAAITTLVIMAWLLACLGLLGLSEEDLRRAPLKGWRRQLRVMACWITRALFVCGGFHRLKVKGRQAAAKEAPVLVLAPHSSFCDALVVAYLGAPSVVAKGEAGRMPVLGKLINYTQPVYVWREDPNSRQNTIKEIIERATSKEDWPQVMIFPEGTCTNRSCLITFKSGAFYPGVPVQPVCIKYPNKLDTVTWTWEGPGALKLLWLTLTQLNSSCEIEFLPVYKPSEEEKTDPKLYANNVRRIMAEALKIPVSDYTYDDCRIISKAHQLQMPNTFSIVEAHKLRYKLGLVAAKTEEELVQKKTERYGPKVDLNEFARILRIDPENPLTQQLFRIHDKNGKGMIDIEQYLFIVLTIAYANCELEMVEVALDVCGSKTLRCVTQKELRKALRLALKIPPSESDKIFDQGKMDDDSTIMTYEEVVAGLSERAEFGYLFTGSLDLKKKKGI